jgi:predicted nucleic acid-binding protein
LTPTSFLDTNIILRHVMQDHDDHSPRASALFSLIEHEGLRVRATNTVVVEAVFTLEKFFKVPRTQIRDAIQPVIDLPGLVLPGKRIYDEVFPLWVLERGLSFTDCYHLCFARQQGIPVILSFDRRMNRLPGVELREP